MRGRVYVVYLVLFCSLSLCLSFSVLFLSSLSLSVALCVCVCLCVHTSVCEYLRICRVHAYVSVCTDAGHMRVGVRAYVCMWCALAFDACACL